jgi:undecaprenyl-diphosphatase
MSVFSYINAESFRLADTVANPALNMIMKYWAESFYVVLLALLAYLYIKKDENIFPYAISVVVLYGIGEIIKLIVMEPRPCANPDFSWINQVGCESGYSFPSNHATVLTGLFIFFNNYKYVRAAYIIWVIIVLFGRIYLGQHYMTDVIVGAIISIAFCYMMHKYRKRIDLISKKILVVFSPVTGLIGI